MADLTAPLLTETVRISATGTTSSPAALRVADVLSVTRVDAGGVFLTESLRLRDTGATGSSAGGIRIRDILGVERIDPTPGERVRFGDSFATSGSRVELIQDQTIRIADAITARITLALVSLSEAARVTDAVTTSALPPILLSVTLSERVVVRDPTNPPWLSTVVVAPIALVQVALELNGPNMGWTDITQDVAIEPGISIRHAMSGRLAETPTASFDLLDNAGTRPDGTTRPLGYYSRFHANARPGWQLNVACRVQFQDPATGLNHIRFLGRVDTADVSSWTRGRRRVTVTAVGWLDEATRWNLVPTIGEQLGRRGNEVMAAIIDAMPVKPFAQSLDIGAEEFPFVLDQSSVGQPAYTEFGKLAASEFGRIFEQPDGTVRFEGRHVRAMTSTSLWTVTDADFLAPDEGLRAAQTRDQVRNTVLVTVHRKRLAENSIIYTQTDPIQILATTTKVLVAEWHDADTNQNIGATDVQPLVAGSDWSASELAGGISIDRTADITLTMSPGASGVRFDIVNPLATDVWVTSLRVQGTAIFDAEPVTVEAKDTASIATYGERVFEMDMPYEWDTGIGQSIADYVLDNLGPVVARVQLFAVHSRRGSATLTQILTRTISDRITITNVLTGYNSTAFINSIEFLVDQAGIRATYEVERLITAPVTYWLLGTNTLGVDTTPAPF